MAQALSVREAARQLEVSVSHVHRLLDADKLRGGRLGSQRVVYPESLREYQLVRPTPGRPLDAKAAWATLLEARPQSLEELRPLAAATRRRATTNYCRVLPFRLAEISKAKAVVLSASHGAARRGAHVGSSEVLHIYVRDEEWEAVQGRYSIGRAEGDLNLIARVVPDDAWPFRQGLKAAPLVVCALDSYSSADLRSAHEALDRIGAE